jgi:beta-lactam-binding protein with PASTA domain
VKPRPQRPRRGQLGAQQIAVPDLRGMTLRQATLQLANTNLALGQVSRIRSGTDSLGSCAPRRRAPAPRLRSAIRSMSSSRSPRPGEPYLMPSLVGQDANDVKSLVESRGFKIGRFTYRAATGSIPETVLGAVPSAGIDDPPGGIR